MVSLSTIASSVASVSRCSFSQASVNLHDDSPPSERRQVERAEAVVVQPAHVGVEEGAQVRHAVLQHGDAVDAHAPGEALHLLRIVAAEPDDVRVDHAAAQNLQPVVALAEADLVADAAAADVDLHRRLGEREERRAEAHLHLVDLEEGAAELLQHPLHVADGGSPRR